MYIWLMRHGRAPLTDGEDAKRQLSPRGLADVSKTAGTMATYVRTGQTVVYCSPTVRTAETADIVCSAFGIDRAVPSVYLENGDLGALYRYILINNRNSTVILVGHTP